MTEFIQGIVAIISFRAVTILCGLAIVYFGFSLFRLGFYEKAGELKATWGSKNLTLKQVAPGIFFALFGAGIIVVAVWKDVEFRSQPPTSAITSLLPLSAYTPLPESLKSSLKAAADGKQLAEADRKALTDWLEAIQRIENTIDYKAYDLKIPKDPTKGEPG